MRSVEPKILPSTRAGRRVLVFGYPRLAAQQEAALSALGWQTHGWNTTHVKGNFILRAPFCDVVYQVGGPLVPKKLFDACRMLGKPIVKHWVGTDVTRAMDESVRRQNTSEGIVHWAVAPWLVDELRCAGINAEVMPLSVIGDVSLLPLGPQPLTALAFLTPENFEFYGGQMILGLAERLPDVRFLVVGSARDGRRCPPNVEFLGFRDDMEEIYGRSHVLIRMPDHDGLSYMILEALNYGREAIWNYPFEGARLAVSADGVASHLSELRAKLAEGRLALNRLGREYVRERYLGAAVLERISKGIEAAVDGAVVGANRD